MGDRIGERFEILVRLFKLARSLIDDPMEVAYLQSARDHLHQGVQLDGFQHIIDRAALHRLHGRIDRAMTGHDDAGDIG